MFCERSHKEKQRIQYKLALRNHSEKTFTVNVWL